MPKILGVNVSLQGVEKREALRYRKIDTLLDGAVVAEAEAAMLAWESTLGYIKTTFSMDEKGLYLTWHNDLRTWEEPEVEAFYAEEVFAQG